MDKAAEPEFQLTNDVGGQAVDVLTDKLVGHMLIALISEPKNTFYAKNATIHSYNSCIFLCVLQLTAAEEAQLWGTCTCSDLVVQTSSSCFSNTIFLWVLLLLSAQFRKMCKLYFITRIMQGTF